MNKGYVKIGNRYVEVELPPVKNKWFSLIELLAILVIASLAVVTYVIFSN